MSNQLLRGELLLNQSEFAEFTKKLEKVFFDQYGFESPFIPWRLHPLDQTIRTHTPSSISLAAALRELDATVDPSLLYNQSIHRRSSIKHESTPTQSVPTSPAPVTVPVTVQPPEVRDEPRHKVVYEKVEFDPQSDIYMLLNPGQDKLKYLPEWAKSIHKILKEICYQPFCKPFLEYFKKRNENKDDNNKYNDYLKLELERKNKEHDKDDLDFDDMSDDLHDILMDLDQPSDNKTDSVDKKLQHENNEEKMELDHDNKNDENKDNKENNNKDLDKLDNYVKVEKDDTHKTEREEPLFKQNIDMVTIDKDNKTNEDRETKNVKDVDFSLENNNNNKETELKEREEKENIKKDKEKDELDKTEDPEKTESKDSEKEKETKLEMTLEHILENLLSNKYENSSKVFSLLYGFLVDQFKELSPGSYDWMCAQDVSNKLDQLRVNKGLNDAEWLSGYNQEQTSASVISPVPSVGASLGPSVQFVSETQQSLMPEPKNPRTSMEDFEHELALINNVDEYSPTISLPEVKNITDHERMEFYENAVLLDTEYQLELFTVFEHAAVWKLVGNGEIELDDQNTDPKIYRGMIKWVKEKRSLCQNLSRDKHLNLSQVSEITV